MKNPDSSAQLKMANSKIGMSRRDLGSYYTPQHLAKLIADETLDRWLARTGNLDKSRLKRISELDKSHRQRILNVLRNIRVLDPAVGDGAFLLAAADWLNEARTKLGDLSSSSERMVDIVKNSLYGVDVVNEAVDSCKENLVRWCMKGFNGDCFLTTSDLSNIKRGNSLLGSVTIGKSENPTQLEFDDHIDLFHWPVEFKEIMQPPDPGFDVVIGNPPYGNLLSQEDRMYIKKTAAFCVGGGRNGTWNSAAHFISRSRALMKNGACLGFLVPNSILRVNQFSKIRKFLLNETCLWKIIDEGSPFEDVTLEMVSLFCQAASGCDRREVEIESRRQGFEQVSRINLDIFRSSKVFSIYHDSTYSEILEHGKRNMLTATRGRDIPKEHVSQTKSRPFEIPYITSGRSVGRYRINKQWLHYADDWFLQDQRMRDSFENELLVATKNYRYPRCVIKPKGTIHGGGIVKISPLAENVNLRAMGLILNSRLIQYICIRYLTNYSQLTTCLNTGIMESLPIVLPEHTNVFSILFDSLSYLSSIQTDDYDKDFRQSVEMLCDALVYELYFSKHHRLQNLITKLPLKTVKDMESIEELHVVIQDKEMTNLVEGVMRNSRVAEIEERLGIDYRRFLR
jgi:predicted RNA methylase